MKVEHLGQMVDIDPREAAIHHTVLRYLKRFQPLTERALWLNVRSRGCTDAQYTAAVDYLAGRGFIVRSTTNYTNSFLLRLAKPPKRAPLTPSAEESQL